MNDLTNMQRIAAALTGSARPELSDAEIGDWLIEDVGISGTALHEMEEAMKIFVAAAKVGVVRRQPSSRTGSL